MSRHVNTELSSQSLLRPILQWCYAHLALEVAVEGGGFSKAEAVGDFVDHQVGVLQQHLGLQQRLLVEPLTDGATAIFLDEGTQAVGRQQQVFGIELDASLT